ncbi:phospholipase A2 inhibitor PIP-like [Salminus brasiliensis]|uniref:phospholipase A2 inhibitor PIP-like n=1 Tax=Salminus brasiliensis TaxID=930266 RepID=UPI003B82D679
MEMQVTLVLISVFFTKGLALMCYECAPFFPFTCDRKQPLECPEMCSSFTSSIIVGGVQLDNSVSACIPSLLCVSGRLNLGVIKATLNSKCCKTELCNNQTVPALPKQPRNGKKCCLNSDCSETVSCEGDEDRCINGTVTVNNFKVAARGCASRSICEGLISITHNFNLAGIKCCEGNLCNTANSMALTSSVMGINLHLLIMLGSLFPFSLIL